MAELTPIPSAQRPADPGYQPVSGYAVAATVVAGLFAVVLVILVGVSLYSRRTALSYEVLLLAIVGVVLAAIGRSQVRNSEGTRTGMRLATTAWWICVLGGVGFAAYLYANEMALERKSAREADRFFEKLKAGKVYEAFEFMLPPEERGRADPNVPDAFEAAYFPAGLPVFKNHELVRLIVRNGSAAELEHTGVKDLGQEASGFRATHLYRLTCPEGVFEIQVKLMAAESRKTRDFQWYIPGQPAPNFSVRPVRISEYGRLMIELEQEGDSYVKSWMNQLTGGRIAWAHEMTLAPSERRQQGTAALAGGPATVMPYRMGSLPADRTPATLADGARLSFDDLAAAGFFRGDLAGTAIAPDRQSKLRELWAPPRLTPSGGRQVQPGGIMEAPVTTVAADAMTVVTAAELTPNTPMQFIRCHVATTCTETGVLAALTAARAKGAAPDDMSVTLKNLPPRDWRVGWFQTDMEAQAVATGPPGR
ncbi:MAG: hypothetical protein J2P46_06415 [Zavarzinella sp.]|nr:hypothetical protein [Zavarzinella sp.]